MAYSDPTPNQALFPGFTFSIPDMQIPHTFDFQSVHPSNFTLFPSNPEMTPQSFQSSTNMDQEMPHSIAFHETNESSNLAQNTQEDENASYERQLSSLKGVAIQKLWTSFQRVATNLSFLVAEERKRSQNDLQESLHLWPLFHQTASSLTTFYEEAISVYGRGRDQGIEYGKIVERRELVNKSKKYRKLKKESQQFPDNRPPSASGEYEDQWSSSQPSSPCPNCGFSQQKPPSPIPGQHLAIRTRPNVPIVEQNRKRNLSLNTDEIPMEISLQKKPKYL